MTEQTRKNSQWLDEHFPNGGDRKSNIKVADGNLDKMPVSLYESTLSRKTARTDAYIN